MAERAAVTVVVQLGGALAPVAERGHALHALVEAGVHAALANLLADLGLPGAPAVALAAADDALPPARLARLLVHDVERPHPDDLVERAACCAAGVRGGALPGGSPATWAAVHATDAQLVGFMAWLCHGAVAEKPSALLNDALVAAVAADLPPPTDGDPRWPPEPGWLHAALAPVLDAGVSVADRRTVAEALGAAGSDGEAAEDAAERLLAALRPGTLDVELAESYLSELFADDGPTARGRFGLLREGLTQELGVPCPPVRLLVRPGLPDRGVAVRVNHLRTVPRVGLAPDELFTDLGPPGLGERGLEGATAPHPDGRRGGAVLRAAAADRAAALGVATWDPLEYLILELAAVVRARAGALLSRDVVEGLLDGLAGVYPALVAMARRRLAAGALTRLLRALLDERLSIRNLRRILGAALDLDHVVVDDAALIVLDDRLPVPEPPTPAWLAGSAALTAFVRTELKRQITHAHTIGQSGLTVVLVHPDLEQALRRGALDARAERRALAELRDLLAPVPGHVTPAVLTLADVRPPLRERLRGEFPRLPVLAYPELSADVSVTPLGRIGG